MFSLLLLCINKTTTTTNFHTKSRAQTFSGSLSAAGLVRPQSGGPGKKINPISTALLHIGPVSSSLHYLCVPYMPHFTCVQTTRKLLFFCFWLCWSSCTIIHIKTKLHIIENGTNEILPGNYFTMIAYGVETMDLFLHHYSTVLCSSRKYSYFPMEWIHVSPETSAHPPGHSKKIIICGLWDRLITWRYSGTTNYLCGLLAFYCLYNLTLLATAPFVINTTVTWFFNCML